MSMRMEGVRQSLGKLWRRLVVSTVENVPEGNAVCEFDCRAPACDWNKWETCERRSAALGEAHTPMPASGPPTLQGIDIIDGDCEPANKPICAAEVAARILAANPDATISNVLVLGTKGSTPMKRTEIRFDDPKQIPAILNLLAAALQAKGVNFCTVQNPYIPATEIWLTSALDHAGETLIGVAAE